VSLHSCSAAEQKGLGDLQARNLILLTALHYGQAPDLGGAGVGEHLDAPQVQLHYAVGAVLLRILLHVGTILSVHHAPIHDGGYEPSRGRDHP
jgi:hypothetical protein